MTGRALGIELKDGRVLSDVWQNPAQSCLAQLDIKKAAIEEQTAELCVVLPSPLGR